MLKKMLAVLLAAAACLTVSGCSGSKEYNVIKDVQKDISNLQSGRIIVTAKLDNGKRSDMTVTEFTFRVNASGNYEYCQTQFDSNNKAVFCEFSDGEKSEQWLVGSGWTASDSDVYNKKKPHRYIQLLSTPFESKAVSGIETAEEGANKRYTMVLDPERLNETAYLDSDSQIKEETVSILVNDKGEMVCYNDQTNALDKSSQKDCSYTLEMQLSDCNAVTEIARPELRDYSKKAS